MLVTRSKSIVEQVNEILRERIHDATYKPGQRLPSESELAEQFGVSRATVRTVLAKLSVEGLILRRQGDGTYVNERIQDVNTHLGGLWDFTRLIETSGFSASIQALSVELTKATEKEALLLAIEPGEELLLLKRLFFADKTPVILARNLVPQKFLSAPIETIDGNLHIRHILREYCEQEIAFAVTEIRSAACDDAKEYLHLDGKTHILNLRMAFYSKENHPLALGNSYFDDSKLRLRLVQAWN
jgi:GntR family transcriptional regulator